MSFGSLAQKCYGSNTRGWTRIAATSSRGGMISVICFAAASGRFLVATKKEGLNCGMLNLSLKFKHSKASMDELI